MNLPEDNTFGTLLKYFRRRRGWTQVDLAVRIKKSSDTVSLWERHFFVPGIRETVILIADVLKLDLEETNQLLFAAQYPLKERVSEIKRERLIHEVPESEGAFSLVRSLERCDYYAYISLPPNYVERVEVLTNVRSLLLSNISAVTLTSAVKGKPAALHGMGGIGKSVIARALCDDPVVQAAFPNGILWATLGQTPDIISTMRLWIMALGGTVSEQAPTIDSLKVDLAQLLKDRACLLILDDVWQHTHGDHFRICGPRCRLLLTTRDSAIARELGAKVLPIPLMTQDEAIQLLEEWADGRLADINPVVKGRIVKRLGHLPLAIKLAGAQLQSKPPLEWLHNFDVRKLNSSRPETLHDIFERTFAFSLDALDADARRLYTALAIFKEDEATPEAGIRRLWQGLGDLDSSMTADLIEDLAARALLDLIPNQPSRKVLLHDLLRDLISLELGDKRIAAHQALLNAYRSTCEGIGWHTAHDDDYLYDHMAYHLHSVGAIDELKALFADQNWFSVRVPQCGYTYDGYLADLTITERYAEADVRYQINTSQEPASFADTIRYALIRTSVTSLAERLVPELVAQAVKVGLWTSYRAFSVASKIVNTEKRAKMYLALLMTGTLDAEQQEKAQQMGLETALTTQDFFSNQLGYLATLAPLLSEKLRTRALHGALELLFRSWIPDDKDQLLRSLRVLAPQLTGELCEQVLEKVLAFEYEDAYADALTLLVPQLPEARRSQVIEQALEKISAFDFGYRAQALTALAPHLTEALAERALEIMQKLKEEWAHENIYARGWLCTLTSRFLVALAPQLPEAKREQMLKEVLKLVSSITYVDHRAEVVAALAPLLSEKQRIPVLEQSLEAVLINDGLERKSALAVLAPHLTETLLKRKLELVLSHRDEDSWESMAREEGPTTIAAMLVPHLTGTLRERALEIVLTAGTTKERVQTLAALTPQLPEEQRTRMREQALEEALKPASDWVIAHAIVTLAPQLTGALLEKALEVALSLGDSWARSYTLAALAPQLTGALLERALETSLGLEDQGRSIRVLTEIIPLLPAEQHPVVLERALRATLELGDTWTRMETLVTFIPYFSEEQRTRAVQPALEAALMLRNGGKLVEVLQHLNPFLSEEQRYQALKQAQEVVLAIKGQHHQLTALTIVAELLPAEQRTLVLEQALETIVRNMNKLTHIDVLEKLVPLLNKDVLEQALEAALAFQNESARARALVVMAPRLSGEQLARTLKVAQLLTNEHRVQALAAIAHLLLDEQRTEVLEQALEATLPFRSTQAWIEALAALAQQLQGKQRTKVLEQALRAALALVNVEKRVDALMPLIPQLSEAKRIDVLKHSVKAALSLVDISSSEKIDESYDDESSFINSFLNALNPLIPYLSDELSEYALATALELKNPQGRRRALVALAPQLDEKQRIQALQHVLAVPCTCGHRQQIFCRTAFLPFALDQAPLAKLIRLAMEDEISRIKYQSYQEMFSFLSIPKLLTPPIISSKTLEAIISHLIEICEEWRWL